MTAREKKCSRFLFHRNTKVINPKSGKCVCVCVWSPLKRITFVFIFPHNCMLKWSFSGFIYRFCQRLVESCGIKRDEIQSYSVPLFIFLSLPIISPGTCLMSWPDIQLSIRTGMSEKHWHWPTHTCTLRGIQGMWQDNWGRWKWGGKIKWRQKERDTMRTIRVRVGGDTWSE